jgi:hypothetical protein
MRCHARDDFCGFTDFRGIAPFYRTQSRTSCAGLDGRELILPEKINCAMLIPPSEQSKNECKTSTGCFAFPIRHDMTIGLDVAANTALFFFQSSANSLPNIRRIALVDRRLDR